MSADAETCPQGTRMRGLIILNAYTRRPQMLHQAGRLTEEFALRGVDVEVWHNDRFLAVVDGDGIATAVDGFDFCIFLDKDRYTLRCLQISGIPLFNSYESIMACDDKMMTYIELAGRGFRMPRTLPGLLCYDPDAVIGDEVYERIEGELGYPVVVKECHGSMGTGVFLARDRGELGRVMSEVKCDTHLIQEAVTSSMGRDLRVMVVGDRVLGGMLRSSDGFQSNIAGGGHGAPYELDDALVEESLGIARALGLVYCGIDYLFGEDGPVVCEVNSNAFFMEFERVTGINIAGEYADLIIRRLEKGL